MKESTSCIGCYVPSPTSMRLKWQPPTLRITMMEDKEEEGDKVECEGGATEEASNKASSNYAGVK